MICPHCRVEIYEARKLIPIGTDVDGGWVLVQTDCPSCRRMILRLVNGPPRHDLHHQFIDIEKESKVFLVRPKGILRPPCPSEVTKEFAEDYIEACLVISDSPKASAALSRRCLQNILREVAKVKPNNLDKEIQQVIDSGTLPSYIIDVIDAIRNIGNFAAHSLKSEKTGEILPVEPMEAEWNLDVLEALFDFYFVQPAVVRKKRAILDQKLKEAGKKPMK